MVLTCFSIVIESNRQAWGVCVESESAYEAVEAPDTFPAWLNHKLRELLYMHIYTNTIYVCAPLFSAQGRSWRPTLETAFFMLPKRAGNLEVQSFGVVLRQAS